MKRLREDSGITRCWWCGDDPLYVRYHDREWGFGVGEDHLLFEKICLEGFQSGLSWLTILRKRDNFRAAFRGFDFRRVSRFNSRSVERLLRDEGIVRHRGKIESTINNSRRAIEIVEEFGSLLSYFRRYASKDTRFSGLPAFTDSSTELSRDLKRRGWTFVGPTTAYAFMQAVGLVNDHVPGCDFRQAAEVSRRETVLR